MNELLILASAAATLVAGDWLVGLADRTERGANTIDWLDAHLLGGRR